MGAGESEQRGDGAATVSASVSAGAAHEAKQREKRRLALTRSKISPVLSAALLAPLF